MRRDQEEQGGIHVSRNDNWTEVEVRGYDLRGRGGRIVIAH